MIGAAALRSPQSACGARATLSPLKEQTPLFLLGCARKVGTMLKLETRCDLSRMALTVGLSCVLALYLFIAGLASAMQSARNLDPHALCLTDAAGESLDGGGSTPASPHHHGLCCTLADGSVALFAPTAFVVVAYAPAFSIIHPTFDFGARPSTAPPGLGQGPRAPPSDLV
jgi:hypothetical protein